MTPAGAAPTVAVFWMLRAGEAGGLTQALAELEVIGVPAPIATEAELLKQDCDAG